MKNWIPVGLMCALLACPRLARANTTFAGLSPATDVATAHAGFDARVERVLLAEAARPIAAQFPKQKDDPGFVREAIGHLNAGLDVDAINQVLLSPDTQPWPYGTNIVIVENLCYRVGDYDFIALDVVRLAYLFKDQPTLLWPETLERIATVLLPENGTDHYLTFTICGVKREDTENHILMTETSRYLTNQLLQDLGYTDPAFDNATSGFDDWMVQHLATFLREHFDEYNSRPYQGYSVAALNNLHSFARSPRVKLAARIVLDYLSAYFAAQSNGGRRNVPFRRRTEHEGAELFTESEPEMPRFALLAGSFAYTEGSGWVLPYGDNHVSRAAFSEYRVPDMLLDLIVSPERHTSYQRMMHLSPELYAASPSFFIAGGGAFYQREPITKENHGWAQPTLLIPTRTNSVPVSDFIRIAGDSYRMTRNNTCVAPGFACGVNLSIPATIPAACQTTEGNYHFFDFASASCPQDHGFYAAVYIEPCDSTRCSDQGTNFGFWEAREASALTFDAFRQAVLDNNAGTDFKSSAESEYVTSDGRSIRFEAAPANHRVWPIIALDGVQQERDFEKWPFATGDIIQATGDGLVHVANPTTGEELLLDLSNPLDPKRTLNGVPTTGVVADDGASGGSGGQPGADASAPDADASVPDADDSASGGDGGAGGSDASSQGGGAHADAAIDADAGVDGNTSADATASEPNEPSSNADTPQAPVTGETGCSCAAIARYDASGALWAWDCGDSPCGRFADVASASGRPDDPHRPLVPRARSSLRDPTTPQPWVRASPAPSKRFPCPRTGSAW